MLAMHYEVANVPGAIKRFFKAMIFILAPIFLGMEKQVAASNKTGDIIFKNVKSIGNLLPKKADWGSDVSGPLCGVYASCTALEFIGIKVNPTQFIATRYVGQCGGSTPTEITRMIVDAGAYAHTIQRMSALDLRLINCPLVANVRRSPSSKRFNHWVVAIPNNENITIYDGIQKAYDITTAEFLGSWSGIGICVTRGKGSPLHPVWLSRSCLFLLVGILGVIAFKDREKLHVINEASVLRQFAAIGITSVVLCIAGNLVFGNLSNHNKGVAVATASNQIGKYHVGTLEHAVRASNDLDVLLVDARREQDYQSGTIKSAVNIPVYASTWAIQKYLDKVDRDTPIVVFCQSANCAYDETIGAQLAALGFTDITVCNEGWSEFKEKMGTATKSEIQHDNRSNRDEDLVNANNS